MAMTRQQIRHIQAVAKYKAGRNKPATRKEIDAWLSPIRAALVDLLSGEVDSHRGYPITRIHWADDDFARIDHAANGFIGLIERLDANFDVSPLRKVSKKLAAGVLLTGSEVSDCLVMLKHVEDRLLCFTREQLVDAANTEQINIELERLGIKEAA